MRAPLASTEIFGPGSQGLTLTCPSDCFVLNLSVRLLCPFVLLPDAIHSCAYADSTHTKHSNGMFDLASAFNRDISTWPVSGNLTTESGAVVGPAFVQTFRNCGVNGTPENSGKINVEWQRQTEKFINPFQSQANGLS